MVIGSSLCFLVALYDQIPPDALQSPGWSSITVPGQRPRRWNRSSRETVATRLDPQQPNETFGSASLDGPWNETDLDPRYAAVPPERPNGNPIGIIDGGTPPSRQTATVNNHRMRPTGSGIARYR
jgi:hypothetical protein